MKYLIKLEKVNINKNTVILEKEWLFFFFSILKNSNPFRNSNPSESNSFNQNYTKQLNFSVFYVEMDKIITFFNFRIKNFFYGLIFLDEDKLLKNLSCYGKKLFIKEYLFSV